MSLTGALREANQDLRNQLRRERQEERRKMLQRVVNAKLDDNGGNNAIDRWKKVFHILKFFFFSFLFQMQLRV